MCRKAVCLDSGYTSLHFHVKEALAPLILPAVWSPTVVACCSAGRKEVASQSEHPNLKLRQDESRNSLLGSWKRHRKKSLLAVCWWEVTALVAWAVKFILTSVWLTCPAYDHLFHTNHWEL